MKTRIDDDKYHDHAQAFVKAISLYVDYHLKEGGEGAAKRQELAAGITFSMCSLFDGSANIPAKDKKSPVIPCLAFHTGKTGELLISNSVSPA